MLQQTSNTARTADIQNSVGAHFGGLQGLEPSRSVFTEFYISTIFEVFSKYQ